MLFGTSSPNTTCNVVRRKKRDGERHGMNQDNHVPSRNICHQGLEQRRKRRFAQRAKTEARERDSDLNAGDHAVQLADQILNDLGAKSASSTSCRTREWRTATSENSTAAKKPFTATRANNPRSRSRSNQEGPPRLILAAPRRFHPNG